MRWKGKGNGGGSSARTCIPAVLIPRYRLTLYNRRGWSRQSREQDEQNASKAAARSSLGLHRQVLPISRSGALLPRPCLPSPCFFQPRFPSPPPPLFSFGRHSGLVHLQNADLVSTSPLRLRQHRGLAGLLRPNPMRVDNNSISPR